MSEDHNDTLISNINTWLSEIKKYISAVKSYINELGSFPTEISVGKLLTNAADLLKHELVDIALIMNVSDAGERSVQFIDEAITFLPSINAAAQDMSRTFSENLKGLWRAILNFGKSVAACHLNIIKNAWLIRQTQIDFAASYCSENIRGMISTEIYIHALLSKGVTAFKEIQKARDASFAIIEDTPAIASTDSVILAEYHPLQTMTYLTTPLSIPLPTTIVSKNLPTTVVGKNLLTPTIINLPQARLSVIYDLELLIDRKRIISYGSIALISNGLNYRVITRMRTIQTSDILSPSGYVKEHQEPKKSVDQDIVKPFSAIANVIEPINLGSVPLVVSTDNGKTSREFEKRIVKSWAPFAGCHPRVEHYSDAVATIVLNTIQLERVKGWNLELRAQYDHAVLNKLITAVNCSEDALLTALISKFDDQYELTQPDSYIKFKNLIAADSFNNDSYICHAVSQVSFAELDKRLQILHIKPAMVRVPYNVTVREMRLSLSIHIIDVSFKLWQSIKNIYNYDSDVFSLPVSKRKDILMKSFRRNITSLLHEKPINCMPLSLKGFASMSPRLV